MLGKVLAAFTKSTILNQNQLEYKREKLVELSSLKLNSKFSIIYYQIILKKTS
jgi:hypothetical protein